MPADRLWKWCAACAFLAIGAAWAAAAQRTDTVVIGQETKRTVGVVTGLEAGDVACYMTLKDDKGTPFQELADFSVCEHPSVIGKRVTLTYAAGKVPADECGANPECRKTRAVALVMSARVISDAAARAPASTVAKGAPRQKSFCAKEEQDVFSCRTGSKLVSVCASFDASPTVGYIHYRFGRPDSGDPLEMALPEKRLIPSKSASGENVPFAGGGGSWLRFRKGAYAYVVYSGIGKWGPADETLEQQGVVVERDGKGIANLACTSELTGELGPEWFEKVGIQGNGEDFLFPDPPPPTGR